MRWFFSVVTLLLFVTAPAAILPRLGDVSALLAPGNAAPLALGLVSLGFVAVVLTYIFVHPLWRPND